ncbi:MAG: BlaI/MecI/CopY family transcriptional regulator [Sedimentisphaerales bacterium]|nr:BlaI/MecI/CopY family transcriptional regulator [Sedimentisphaerales bacterium]
MKISKPSDLEMQILSVLWNKGDSTVREVLDSMPDGKKRAYTSILSVMQVMEKKGLLNHTTRGSAHVYSPAVNRKKIIRPFMRRVLNEIFAGKPSAVMQALLAETPVSDSELEQIHKLLREAKKSGRQN